MLKKLMLTFMLMALPALVSGAGDELAGKRKSGSCASCHGQEGISTIPIYPNLKGQKAPYIISALQAYKSGQRTGGLSVIMASQAAALSDQDMADLAAYYSSL